jgi:predicted N-acetyltransferase YhbS
MQRGAISIRLMTADDVPMAMVLKTEAKWNQVEADWLRFLDMQPDGCFVAEVDGEPVGTTVTCVFGEVAWVAMVLVAKRLRGMGIGTALMRHALDDLDLRAVRTVRLDATPLGQPIYEKLGFTPEYALARYAGVLGNVQVERDAATCRIRGAGQGDIERLIEIDREVTGTTREKLLSRLFRERPGGVRVAERSGSLVGYLAVRPGNTALQLGPCVGDVETGKVLVADASRTFETQRVYIDVPSRQVQLANLAERAGLSVQRTFVRMCRGPRVREDAMRLLVSSGPELG